jgi:hypothetical protein
MKIAYLIAAHSQPEHLHRLVQALDSEHVSFFIHVDLEADIKAFQDFAFGSNVHFLEERFMVHHAGFSLVRALIKLMNTALEDAENQYFITLSGWDYPIKNNQYIYNFLAQNYPMNFLNFYPLVDEAAQVEFIQKYHFIDLIESVPHVLKVPLKAAGYISRKIPLNRPFIPGIVPYRGSAWFCLNRETMVYVMDFLQTQEGKNYINYFKWVSCADEIMFHTIVLHSPYAKYCRYYERDIELAKTSLKNENNAYLHYIDWDPTRENPAQLDMRDFDKLMQSEALFARKFNEIKSKDLLDAIDQNRKTSQPDYLPQLSGRTF